MVSRLQVKASQIGKILQSLENKHVAAAAAAAAGEEHHPAHATHGKKQSADAGHSGVHHQPPVKKPHYIDPIPPFNASRVRKSPSSALMETSACELALQEPPAQPADAVDVAAAVATVVDCLPDVAAAATN